MLNWFHSSLSMIILEMDNAFGLPAIALELRLKAIDNFDTNKTFSSDVVWCHVSLRKEGARCF
jgi:hypothetical protein